jgi:amino acid adenylation domain-containing protein
MASAPHNSLLAEDPESPCSPQHQPSHGPYPLTHAQESLWFVEQLRPGTPAYNLPEALVLNGRLDQAALQRSLDHLVARHETLRTFFKSEGGKPKQHILNSSRFPFKVCDLSGSPVEKSDVREFLRQEGLRLFDLAKAPLASATLFCLAPEEHVLLLNVHHIISDAWSQEVFKRELFNIYGAEVEGRCPVLPELSVQYADFSLWQRELVLSELGTRHLQYWRDRFSAPPEPLQLHMDYPRARATSLRGATQFYELSQPLVESLRELSRKHGVTPYMILLASFKAFLHRVTGNDQIVVGSPMACRERVELEALIGFFVHTQPLWSDLSGDPSFTELLARIREVVLAAYEHQEVPCQLALQGSQTQGTAGNSPLFQVVFGWQGASPHNWSNAGLDVAKLEMETGTAKFDWTVLVTESDKKLCLRCEFSTDLFDPSTIAGWMHQFERLLESAVASPGQRISQLAIQSESERSQVVVEWNRTETVYERDQQIHQVFEASVAKTPDAIAVSFQGKSLTYKELNRRANRVAHRLQHLGISDGTKVGLSIERSFELVIGILGILKAGGVYVPLDPTYPRERLEFMVRDCGITLLLTQSSFTTQLSSLGKTLFCLDQTELEANNEGDHDLPARGSPESPAYVMYTSGSTGTPKGALIPHRAIVRLVRNTDYLDFGPDRVFLQLAPVTFDASTFEIWGALLNGARLVLFPPGLPSLESIGRQVHEGCVDVLWLTAGLFHQIVDHQLSDLRGLKYLLAGGDVLSPSHVAKALRELPDCQLINGYGPTENTTFTCCYPIPRGWPADRPVPIGHPISNTTVYVLDRFGAVVPPGVPGELYAGGDGVALGYLNQPELNAERFVPNPFDPRPGSRLYRTGDSVRWRSDGSLEFLGRSDSQVKIRGYRVEPGEVETVLSQHRLIEACAVVVRENPFIGKHLVAYLVPRSGGKVDIEQLREFLGSKLPAYFLPSNFVTLPVLPLTANGKVDRRALAALQTQEQPGQHSDEAKTQTELIVANIWADVLGVAEVDADASFFQLGGHSLLAAQVISRISKTCHVDLPVVSIFEAPTVRKLAKLVDGAQEQQPDSSLAAFAPSGRTRAAELLSRLDEFSEAELEELLRDPKLKSVL